MLSFPPNTHSGFLEAHLAGGSHVTIILQVVARSKTVVRLSAARRYFPLLRGLLVSQCTSALSGCGSSSHVWCTMTLSDFVFSDHVPI